MTTRESRSLRAPIDPVEAAGLLDDWGFLAHSDLPNDAGDAYLLVALRDDPTLRHFDAERVELWVTRGARGARLTVSRTTRPLETEFSWGTIAIVDRLGISNEYVSFGGHLSVAEINGMTVVSLVSSAPILRRGGHSQGWDEAAVDLAAFFGRILIAVDYVPGFEAKIAGARPGACYAGFVAETTARFRRSGALRGAHAALWMLLRGEERRLRQDHPDDWTDGVALAVDAGLHTPN